MPTIEKTTAAKLDLVDIWCHIAVDNIAAADKLLRSVDERLNSLSRMPQSAEEVASIGKTIRRSSVGNYVIYFRPINDGIQVLRVLHGARKHEDHF